MAVNASLESVLSIDEIKLIPPQLVSRLENHLNQNLQNIESLKSQNIQLRASSERYEFQFEKELFENQKKVKEADELSEKLKSQCSNLEEKYCQSQAEVENLRETLRPLQNELDSLKRLCEELKQDKNNFIQQLERQKKEYEKLQGKTLRFTQNQNSSLRNNLEEKNQKVEDLVERLKELQDSHNQSDENFQAEIRAQTKLVELYKQSYEDSQQKNQELLHTIEEMHKMLREVGENHSQLEQKLSENETKWEGIVHEKELEVHSLKKELEHANDLLKKPKGVSEEGIEKMFPMAAATSKILRTGMTLTQVYSEFVRAEEELQKEKSEKQQLHEQLQQILG
ncbi:nucleoprotein TPR-like, partial [Limulus polyphemus]|uniref:Nucleoprotein TPR-like n=1 Tax=Limulus polyphemus TaxID=6850 RepID=A0ABM1BWA7_LIMPO